jgi:SAM-dependent methyltransferase/uncharacterized protein YbaR (Trm112 family)
MYLDSLNVLECPFCGSPLALQPDPPAQADGDRVRDGILACQCCAFPVVAGIPYLVADEAARRAMTLLGERAGDEALLALLDPGGQRRSAVSGLLGDANSRSFEGCLEVLRPNLEGEYLLHRFSDPTFLGAAAISTALVRAVVPRDGHVLDVCGGTGHLARRIAAVSPARRVTVADLGFWRLWLARRFVAPECEFVCCDANGPLPFVRGAFAYAGCTDAFHYIWHRRQLAGEMARLLAPGGVALLGHVHNALVDNPSAGMPLDPRGYRRLFAPLPARLFRDSDLLRAALAGSDIDLSADADDETLAGEAALVVVASSDSSVFRPHRQAPRTSGSRLRINPLYEADRRGGDVTLTLRFPSAHYEEEFGGCQQYLPRQVTMPAAALDRALHGEDEIRHDERWRYVLLDLPDRYTSGGDDAPV